MQFLFFCFTPYNGIKPNRQYHCSNNTVKFKKGEQLVMEK